MNKIYILLKFLASISESISNVFPQQHCKLQYMVAAVLTLYLFTERAILRKLLFNEKKNEAFFCSFTHCTENMLNLDFKSKLHIEHFCLPLHHKYMFPT